jgi:hypothetical protein
VTVAPAVDRTRGFFAERVLGFSNQAITGNFWQFLYCLWHRVICSWFCGHFGHLWTYLGSSSIWNIWTMHIHQGQGRQNFWFTFDMSWHHRTSNLTAFRCSMVFLDLCQLYMVHCAPLRGCAMLRQGWFQGPWRFHLKSLLAACPGWQLRSRPWTECNPLQQHDLTWPHRTTLRSLVKHVSNDVKCITVLRNLMSHHVTCTTYIFKLQFWE